MNTTPHRTAPSVGDDRNAPCGEALRGVSEELDQQPPVRVPSPVQAARRLGASLGLTEEEIRAVGAELAERGLHLVTSYLAWLCTMSETVTIDRIAWERAQAELHDLRGLVSAWVPVIEALGDPEEVRRQGGYEAFAAKWVPWALRLHERHRRR